MGVMSFVGMLDAFKIKNIALLVQLYN